MPQLELGPHDALYYEYETPKAPTGCTFVFFNALTGDMNTWQSVIGPNLRDGGHGTLSYNMRGQTDSPFSPALKLDADLIVNDALKLFSEVKPVRPILVGLSIGGLFAVSALLQGAEAIGLVLINTLRKDGPRLQWIGDALVRAVEVGGVELLRDLFLPLLVNEEWLRDNRSNFLKSNGIYTPLKTGSGLYKLLAQAGRNADWNLPYDQLNLPTLVITGLQDHVFLEPGVVDELFARLPRGQRVDMTDAGHLVPNERPEKLSDVLLKFAGGL